MSLLELLALEPGEWGPGPYTAEVRSRVSTNRDRLAVLFRRYNELVQSILASGVDCVITHGEPHAANVVQTDGGAMLIERDTVRWAPRERDLWALHEGWSTAYGDIPISEEIIEVYRLQWKLREIAEFACDLAFAEHQTPDLDVAKRELCNYLPGAAG